MPEQKAKSPEKRLFICCDGTWEDSNNSDQPITNVTRIARCVPSKDSEGVLQIVYYQSGIGTGLWKSTNSAEAATGRGLSANIRDAYSFLCHNYSSGDEIVLIGFSRGAYTVRCLANLVYDIGILTKRGLTSLDSVYGLWEGHMESKPRPDSKRLRVIRKTLNWRGIFTSDDRKENSEKLHELLQGFDGTILHSDVRIRACAVWDTVASLDSNKLSFVGADLCPNIDFAFQALALNEERLLFQPLVWELDTEHTDAPQVLKQCWFLGDHSNIGGGKEDNTVAAFPLIWMMAQLIDKVGLKFDYQILADFTAEDKAEKVMKTTRDNLSIRMPDTGESIMQYAREKTSTETKVAIQEKVAGLWGVIGTKTRLPCRYQLEHYRELASATNLPKKTNEYVHYTVRALLKKLALKECKALDPFDWAGTDETPKLKLKKPETELLSKFEMEVDEVLIFEAARSPEWMQDEKYSRSMSKPSKRAMGFGVKVPGMLNVEFGRQITADTLELQDESDEDEESI